METTTKIVVLGGFQTSLIALALIAAFVAAYWLSAALTVGSVATAGLNWYHNLGAPHDAPNYLLASLLLTALLFLGFAACGAWVQSQNPRPVINGDIELPDGLPVDPQFMPARERDRYLNLTPTRIDLSLNDVKSHRRS